MTFAMIVGGLLIGLLNGGLRFSVGGSAYPLLSHRLIDLRFVTIAFCGALLAVAGGVVAHVKNTPDSGLITAWTSYGAAFLLVGLLFGIYAFWQRKRLYTWYSSAPLRNVETAILFAVFIAVAVSMAVPIGIAWQRGEPSLAAVVAAVTLCIAYFETSYLLASILSGFNLPSEPSLICTTVMLILTAPLAYWS